MECVPFSTSPALPGCSYPGSCSASLDYPPSLSSLCQNGHPGVRNPLPSIWKCYLSHQGRFSLLVSISFPESRHGKVIWAVSMTRRKHEEIRTTKRIFYSEGPACITNQDEEEVWGLHTKKGLTRKDEGEEETELVEIKCFNLWTWHHDFMYVRRQDHLLLAGIWRHNPLFHLIWFRWFWERVKHIHCTRWWDLLPEAHLSHWLAQLYYNTCCICLFLCLFVIRKIITGIISWCAWVQGRHCRAGKIRD